MKTANKKMPKFLQKVKEDYPIPPWIGDMDESDFISCDKGFEMGQYGDIFEQFILPCKEKGDIRYFVYNPIKHGKAPADRKYPVLMWIHGRSCSMGGMKCIGYSGGEQFASLQYQKAMGGGAFIIVPLANERTLEDNTIAGSWDEEYFKYLKEIYDKVCDENVDHIGAKFIMGGSGGGYVTWRMVELYGDYFQGAIPCASFYTPEVESLKAIDDSGMHLLVAHSRHDELAQFETCIKPIENILRNMRNCICFLPEWIRNKDKGVASVNTGIEMGQHCIIDPVQGNLMYADGSSYDESLPNGITGWIKSVCESK